MRPWELLQPFPFLSSFNRHHEQSYVIGVLPVNGFKFRKRMSAIFFLPSFLSFSIFFPLYVILPSFLKSQLFKAKFCCVFCFQSQINDFQRPWLPPCQQRRLCSDRAAVQAGLRLRWAHMPPFLFCRDEGKLNTTFSDVLCLLEDGSSVLPK